MACVFGHTGLTGQRTDNGLPLGWLWLLLFLATASHGVLDALTTGGLGVAFFSPFEQGRHFFGFRPIQVSPLGLRNFAGARAWCVLGSELLWVGLPCLILLLGQQVWQRLQPYTWKSS